MGSQACHSQEILVTWQHNWELWIWTAITGLKQQTGHKKASPYHQGPLCLPSSNHNTLHLTSPTNLVNYLLLRFSCPAQVYLVLSRFAKIPLALEIKFLKQISWVRCHKSQNKINLQAWYYHWFLIMRTGKTLQCVWMGLVVKGLSVIVLRSMEPYAYHHQRSWLSPTGFGKSLCLFCRRFRSSKFQLLNYGLDIDEEGCWVCTMFSIP